MQYTELKIDPAAIKDKAALVMQSARSKGIDPMQLVVSSIMKRFSLNGFARYTDYGPYWYALKAVLRDYGQDFGDETDADIVDNYAGDNDFETVIAADMFRDFNLVSNPVGTIQYTLDGYTGELWTLHDPDMDL